MSRITRQHFLAVVRDGLPNTSMPAWKNVLSSREMDAIADYVNRVFHPLRVISPTPQDGRY
jgi:cytochrome c oxidase cbb3-type subunit 3